MSDIAKKHLNPVLKMVLELGPLVVFFFVNAQASEMTVGGTLYKPIIQATGAFMIATAVALTVSYVLVRRLPIMPMVSGVFVFIFGALTLWLNDDLFIKLKPTIVNGLFAAILLGGLASGRALLKPLLEEAFPMQDEGWRKLTFRWGLFFIVLAVVNEIVWRNFSTDFWVSFKTFGVMPLTLVFTFTQVPLMQRYAVEQVAEEG